MDNIVKLSEFRANTKVFLNAVRDNQPLLLRRGDELFEIKWKGSVWQGIPRETYVETPPSPKKKQYLDLNRHPGIAPHEVTVDDLEPVYMTHGGTAPSADVSGLFNMPDPDDIRQSNAELECCKHPSYPCKHWVWDIDSGEGYKNILSGRYREAD